MKQKVLFGVSLLFGLLFINAGLNKFLNYMPMPADLPQAMKELMGCFTSTRWLIPLVGAAEVAGGLLVILPRTRALGAVMLFPVIVGILLINICNAPSGLPIALVVLFINAWILFENREKYLPMIRS